jgi:MFS family permease
LAIETEPLPPHFRWNFGAFVVDYATFLIGFGFVNTSSVLPAFIGQLTTSAPLIGLASTIFNAGWTLPQLATAQLAKDRPKKKPFFYIGVPFRATLLVIAAALWAGLASRPTAMLALFFACMGLFALADGFISLVWFDIMARAIPARRRGLLIGLPQFVGGLAGIGVGALVGTILANRPFPNSYALLFTLAGLWMIPSTIALLLIREPPPDVAPVEPEVQQVPWLPLIGRDPHFRRLVGCRLLVGMTSLATPFYVAHASNVIGLPESMIGRFVIANTVGSLVASVVLGYLSQRHGTRFVIHVSSAFAVVGPLLVLVLNVTRADWLAPAYPLAFVALGISMGAWMLGFTNYMLEIAPPHIRPAYLGLGNTLMGLMAFVPTLGGLLLQATSYTVLFASAATLTFCGFLLSLTLRPPGAADLQRATTP